MKHYTKTNTRKRKSKEKNEKNCIECWIEFFYEFADKETHFKPPFLCDCYPRRLWDAELVWIEQCSFHICSKLFASQIKSLKNSIKSFVIVENPFIDFGGFLCTCPITKRPYANVDCMFAYKEVEKKSKNEHKKITIKSDESARKCATKISWWNALMPLHYDALYRARVKQVTKCYCIHILLYSIAIACTFLFILSTFMWTRK